MPTRTHSTDPFAPRGSLSPAQLAAYGEGRLTPAEQREVEAHLENDPLLRDAAEGLQQPGASAALGELHHLRPKAPGSGPALMRIGIAAMAGAIVAVTVWYALPERKMKDAATKAGSNVAPESPLTGNGTIMQPLEPTEIAEAKELPEFQRIGHGPDDRHAKAMAREQPLERATLDRLDNRAIDARKIPSAADTMERSLAKTDAAHRTSVQLLFLYDLKLVHPKEMYARDPQMQLAEASIAARFSDRSDQDSVRSERVTVTYTAFMDEALYRFAQNDHRACLDDLRFLLNQYPDDVNALFYAGLCSYNLGLYKHARNFLHRAATHPIDVFDEEAQWYHALTLERLDEHQAALEAFSRIAASNGFYAERARAHVERAE